MTKDSSIFTKRYNLIHKSNLVCSYYRCMITTDSEYYVNYLLNSKHEQCSLKME